MNVLVIDGQGGGIGKQLIAAIKKKMPNVSVMAVGTNSSATSAMLKAGADSAATGENAVIVGCRAADIIVGPVSIVVADSMLGEVTPSMAAAIGQSLAKRILIPVNRCNNYIVGVSDLPIGKLVQAAVDSIQKSC
ncbi:MAG: DUF3842 family protein [Oscillospiraceae bacterium]|nr:DUF3842 family protein [Oscillospiraceae bacterium]